MLVEFSLQANWAILQQAIASETGLTINGYSEIVTENSYNLQKKWFDWKFANKWPFLRFFYHMIYFVAMPADWGCQFARTQVQEWEGWQLAWCTPSPSSMAWRSPIHRQSRWILDGQCACCSAMFIKLPECYLKLEWVSQKISCAWRTHSITMARWPKMSCFMWCVKSDLAFLCLSFHQHSWWVLVSSGMAEFSWVDQSWEFSISGWDKKWQLLRLLLAIPAM